MVELDDACGIIASLAPRVAVPGAFVGDAAVLADDLECRLTPSKTVHRVGEQPEIEDRAMLSTRTIRTALDDETFVSHDPTGESSRTTG